MKKSLIAKLLTDKTLLDDNLEIPYWLQIKIIREKIDKETEESWQDYCKSREL